MSINLWALLPWQLICIASLITIALIVARPGERRQFLIIALVTWAGILILILGFGHLFGWIGVTA